MPAYVSLLNNFCCMLTLWTCSTDWCFCSAAFTLAPLVYCGGNIGKHKTLSPYVIQYNPHTNVLIKEQILWIYHNILHLYTWLAYYCEIKHQFTILWHYYPFQKVKKHWIWCYIFFTVITLSPSPFMYSYWLYVCSTS